MTRWIEGFATEKGTSTYGARHSSRVAPGHYRGFEGLSLSSIGIGTYLGKDDPAQDALYTESVLASLERGINVIDTAINYRNQRSERAIGEALKKAIFDDRWLGREEILVSTKGGFMLREYFEPSYREKGLYRKDEVVGGCHCMAPKYIHDQIERSRQNLNLATIDVYYLHNPEMQLDEVPRAEFMRRMRAAFETLEQAVKEGRIRWYGTATWNGYREPKSDPSHLGFSELWAMAKEVGGEGHHFRFVQLPYNLAMTEAALLENQEDGGGKPASLLRAAQGRAYVMTSASIMQGKLTQRLPAQVREALSGLDTDAQRAIQFVRSTPGVGTALVGMKRPEHVEENAKLATVAPLPEERLRSIEL
jgi:aryl-alcohol dehydrogenase-like predicted oxidoreductase